MARKLSAAEYSQALRALVRVPAQVAAEVKKEIHFEIQAGFDAGRNPYRKPWAPLKPATIAKGRSFPPLTDDRKGRNAVKVRTVQGSGLQITSGVPYMRKHQFGAPKRNLVARPFLPSGTLPKSWAARYQTAYTRRFKSVLK